MSFWHHIFYYIIYKKYRILVSNTWVFKENRYPSVLDMVIYESVNGKYYFSSYRGVNLISISNFTGRLRFKIDDGIRGQVSKFFMDNHKDKLILPEDKLAYQRDKKLKELGI